MTFRRMAPAIILFLLLCGCGANGNVNLPEDHGPYIQIILHKRNPLQSRHAQPSAV